MHCSQQPLASGERGRESEDDNNGTTTDTKQKKKQKNKGKKTQAQTTRKSKSKASLSGTKHKRAKTPPLKPGDDNDDDATQSETGDSDVDDHRPLSSLKVRRKGKEDKAKEVSSHNKRIKLEVSIATTSSASSSSSFSSASSSSSRKIEVSESTRSTGATNVRSAAAAARANPLLHILTTAVAEVRKHGQRSLATDKALTTSGSFHLDKMMKTLPTHTPMHDDVSRLVRQIYRTRFDPDIKPWGRTVFDSQIGDGDDRDHDVWDYEDASSCIGDFSGDTCAVENQKTALLDVINNRPKRRPLGTSGLKFDKQNFHDSLFEFAVRSDFFIHKKTDFSTGVMGGTSLNQAVHYYGAAFTFDATDQEFCNGTFDAQRSHITEFIRAVSKNRATHSVEVCRVVLQHQETFDCRETETDGVVRRRDHAGSCVYVYDTTDWLFRSSSTRGLIRAWIGQLSELLERNDPALELIVEYWVPHSKENRAGFAWIHIANDRHSELAASNPFLKGIRNFYGDGMYETDSDREDSSVIDRELPLEATTITSTCFGLTVFVRFQEDLWKYCDPEAPASAGSVASSSSSSASGSSASSSVTIDSEQSPLSWSAAHLAAVPTDSMDCDGAGFTEL